MRLHKRGKVWILSFTAKGARVRVSTRCTDRAAALVEASRLVLLAERRAAGLPVDGPKGATEAINEYMALRERAPRYRTFALGVLLGVGISDLAQWTPERLGRRFDSDKPSARMGIAVVKGFCAWCVRVGYMRTDPARGLRLPKLPKPKRRAFTVDELRAFLACPSIPSERRAVYRALLFSGLRRNEARQLEPSMVGADRLMLPARITKGGVDQVVPIVPALASALAALSGGERVFPALPSSRTFIADLARAGVQRADDRGRLLVTHSFRSTLNSILAADGVSADVRRAVLRHEGGTKLVEVDYLDGALLPAREAVERASALLAVPLRLTA